MAIDHLIQNETSGYSSSVQAVQYTREVQVIGNHAQAHLKVTNTIFIPVGIHPRTCLEPVSLRGMQKSYFQRIVRVSSTNPQATTKNSV